jgi:hypothetical protein
VSKSLKFKILVGVFTIIFISTSIILWNYMGKSDGNICSCNFGNYQENMDDEVVQVSQLDFDNNQNIVRKGVYIFINLDELKMYVYKDGCLLKSYPISGGKPSTPSPLGTWKIISKAEWGEGFGGGWLGFNVPWGT